MAAPGIGRMGVVHNGFRCGFAVAPALIRGADNDDNRTERVAAFLTSTLTIVEAHHHEEEGTLFPMLLKRAPQEEDAINAGVAEHHEMLGLLAAAKGSVLAWSTKEAEGTDLILALDAFDGMFSAHMDHEEATIVPLLEQHLDEETWMMLQSQLRERLPQMAELLLPVAYGLSLLWEAVGEAAIKDLLAQPPRH